MLPVSYAEESVNEIRNRQSHGNKILQPQMLCIEQRYVECFGVGLPSSRGRLWWCLQYKMMSGVLTMLLHLQSNPVQHLVARTEAIC